MPGKYRELSAKREKKENEVEKNNQHPSKKLQPPDEAKHGKTPTSEAGRPKKEVLDTDNTTDVNKVDKIKSSQKKSAPHGKKEKMKKIKPKSKGDDFDRSETAGADSTTSESSESSSEEEEAAGADSTTSDSSESSSEEEEAAGADSSSEKEQEAGADSTASDSSGSIDDDDDDEDEEEVVEDNAGSLGSSDGSESSNDSSDSKSSGSSDGSESSDDSSDSKSSGSSDGSESSNDSSDSKSSESSDGSESSDDSSRPEPKGKGRTRVQLKKPRETRSSSHKKTTKRQSPPNPYPKNGSNLKPQYKNAVWVHKVELDEKIPSYFKNSYFYYVYITDENNDEQPKLQTPIAKCYTQIGNWTRIATKDAVGDGIKDNSNNIDDGSGGIINFALEPYVNPNPKTIFTQGKLNESTEKNLNDQPSPKFAKTSQATDDDREKLLCRSIFPDITTAAKLLRDEFLIDHTNRLMFIVLTT